MKLPWMEKWADAMQDNIKNVVKVKLTLYLFAAQSRQMFRHKYNLVTHILITLQAVPAIYTVPYFALRDHWAFWLCIPTILMPLLYLLLAGKYQPPADLGRGSQSDKQAVAFAMRQRAIDAEKLLKSLRKSIREGIETHDAKHRTALGMYD